MFSTLLQELLTDQGYWMKSGGKAEWREEYWRALYAMQQQNKCSECDHCKEQTAAAAVQVTTLEDALAAGMSDGAREYLELMNRLQVLDFQETSSGTSYGSGNAYECVLLDTETGRTATAIMGCSAMNSRRAADAILNLDGGYSPDGGEPWLTEELLAQRTEFSEYYWGTDEKVSPL